MKEATSTSHSVSLKSHKYSSDHFNMQKKMTQVKEQGSFKRVMTFADDKNNKKRLSNTAFEELN